MKIIIAINCDEIKVSDCDYLFLVGYRWSYNKKTGYYHCSIREIWDGQQINGKPFHCVIAKLMGLKIPKGYQIDHIDRNKADNQRNNLRVASRRLQRYNQDKRKSNTSGYPGVTFYSKKKINPWMARICLPTDKQKFLG